MGNFTKQLMYGFAALLLLAAAWSLISGSLEEEKEVSLSELIAQINEGTVSKITVSGDNVSVELKDGTKEKAMKEAGTGFSETLANYAVSQERLKEVNLTIAEPSGFVFWLGAVLPFLAPMLLIGFFIWWTARQVQRGSMQAFTFGQSRARLVDPENEKGKITFKDVAGAKEAKEELKEIVDFLSNPKKFIDIGARIPRGVLLMGAPGTGKTLLAKAVAGEAGVPFFQISGSEFVEMFVGVGASRVRDLFKVAKKAGPAIVFIDEIDAVGRHRGAGVGGGNDEREQTLNQILVEMDGFETDTAVIVMAATNRPDVLDPALLRPGRFDRRVILDLPDINDRLDILKVHAKNKPLDKDIEFRLVAERTPGFSGADLANLINEAAILAARHNRKSVAQMDLIQSIEKVMLGPERKSHILSPKEKEISAYHEAGHALVAASLPNCDPVHKVSIIARGRAAGYTLKLPSEDRHLLSRSYFYDEIAVALGGYAAEKLIFNDLTTGPHSDLEKATDLARDLVTRYGMSDKLGPIVFGDRQEMIFLGKEIATEKNYSEETAQSIDSEITAIIQAAHKKAREIITTRRKKLDEIAARLIEKETIEKDAFAALMATA
ncbi:MAG: cell division protein FtsH [Candidatus Sungbacteria bacterium RIFCSPLOWO2_02_FULL_51_17]|uniref:ATP-dependent zinc metalloprotease FtsH n=1 Tax=Candidatus Sungbacteria bacterium RIFCSPHIGHO2_02_FULL_51_29 TaxID=1802273 RepID=A0A1G2KWY2_9BACT|nr:MAG: cell division protein FtsH [Candidatus Sungbacteria bacterium RIFCSPHIGHO2_01_FULL_51_22]OHA03917.1 MAG: cell division protein FtsH [Candidatus Sungbacteria bacterium RIFCSPHIGHO2_02_FULL_51_29]OHA10626.1 MAG: cell division protein FtsH [Candidatus Sungbacteria bacterium RIFCSPLOWO2_02_FULL_51_17]